MNTKKIALLLINPHSRQGKDSIEKATQILQDLDLELIAKFPENSQNISEVIRQHKNKVDLVIVGGGDGTLNAAVDGIVDAKLPLGIIPLGTANDLARTLNIPTNLSDACEVITTGRKQYIDLGWVNGKHFFNVASLGLSVKITQNLSKEAKKRWGVLAYAATAWQVAARSRPMKAEIVCNGESIKVKTIQIAVGNGRYYGGGMTVAHDATIEDQTLDLYSIEIKHWWQIILALPSLRLGRHSRWLGIRSLQTQEIEIKTSKRIPINTDGEITTYTPAQFRVIPHAIRVIVPYES